jgi:hypothetical protein
MASQHGDSWRGRKKAKEIRRREKLEAKQDRAALRHAGAPKPITGRKAR